MEYDSNTDGSEENKFVVRNITTWLHSANQMDSIGSKRRYYCSKRHVPSEHEIMVLHNFISTLAFSRLSPSTKAPAPRLVRVKFSNPRISYYFSKEFQLSLLDSEYKVVMFFKT